MKHGSITSLKKGNIVIYPRYQENIFTKSDDFTPNAIRSVKEAISILNSSDHVKPDLSRFAIVGHSVGGIISTNMAVLAKERNLPGPKAVFCVESGVERSSKDPEDLYSKLISLVGDSDNIVGNKTAERIFKDTTSIPGKK